MTKLLYVGYYIDDDTFAKMIADGNTELSQARQNFEGRLLYEISKVVPKNEWEIVSYVPRHSLLVSDHSQINGKNITIFKITGNPIICIKAYCSFRKYLLKNKIKNCKVLMYSLHPILSLPIFFLRKKLHLEITTICSELPQYRAAGNKISLLRRIKIKFQARLNRNPDKYVLFTEPMRDEIPVVDKPYIVVEGIAPDTIYEPEHGKQNIVMYAGGLGKQNNIKLLIDACEKSDKVSELWICGIGDQLDLVKSRINSKIHYLGNMVPNQVMQYERKAKVLVNLRDPSVLITRYAFPSKILEYMSAGSATLTTKLEGIPKKYFNYIYMVEDLSVDSVKNAIEELLSMDDNKYVQYCNIAQDWIRHNKTAMIQAKRILKFVLDD